MKLVALALFAVVCLAQQRIAVVNQRATPLDSAVIPAIQKQIDNDFAPAWHAGAVLYEASDVSAIQSPDFYILLVDTLDIHSFGRHGMDTEGKPYGIVFGDGDSVTLSHEILELLADPFCDIYIMFRHSFDSGGDFYKRKICDAVEHDAYQIDGVRVSDFVLPAWYRPASRGPWDFLALLPDALRNSVGGAFSFFSAAQIY